MGSNGIVKGAVVGTVLQVIMVVCGHYIPQVAALFPVLGTALGGVAGFIATRGTTATDAGAAGGTGAAAGLISG